MIGGDHIDRPVAHPREQRLAVPGGAERRIHLETSLLPKVALVEKKVVRRRLAGDVDAAFFRLSDQGNALGGRDMADVVGAARLLREAEIPLDLLPLARGRDAAVAVRAGVGSVVDIAAREEAAILAVRGDDPAERLCPLHRLPHQSPILHASPVVRKGDGVFRHPFKIGDLASLLADGERPVGADADHGVPPDQGELLAEVRGGIRHGREVRHRADVGIPAVRRREGACADRLFIRIPRLAKMHMHVAKAGEHEHFLPLGGEERRRERFRLRRALRSGENDRSLHLVSFPG